MCCTSSFSPFLFLGSSQRDEERQIERRKEDTNAVAAVRCIHCSRIRMSVICQSDSPILYSILISLFLLVLHTHALALTPTLSLTHPTNRTAVSWSYRHCVTDPSWNPQGTEIAPSCENALGALSDDLATWGLQTGTFTYRRNARSTASFPGIPRPLTLPKRYVSGDCVVAVVMMKMFEESTIGQFPGLPDSVIGKWWSQDTSTWKALIEPAEYVRATCDNGCGYTVLGKHFGIGVTSWGTGSPWDRYASRIGSLSELVPELKFANTSVGGLDNRSVAEVYGESL